MTNETTFPLFIEDGNEVIEYAVRTTVQDGRGNLACIGARNARTYEIIDLEKKGLIVSEQQFGEALSLHLWAFENDPDFQN